MRYKDTTNKNGEAGDYRILAEICEKCHIFENDVGQEIVAPNKHYKGTTGYYQAQKHQRDVKTALRIWDDFKSTDTRSGTTYRNDARITLYTRFVLRMRTEFVK